MKNDVKKLPPRNNNDSLFIYHQKYLKYMIKMNEERVLLFSSSLGRFSLKIYIYGCVYVCKQCRGMKKAFYTLELELRGCDSTQYGCWELEQILCKSPKS